MLGYVTVGSGSGNKMLVVDSRWKVLALFTTCGDRRRLTGDGVSPHCPSVWLADVVYTPPSAAEE